MNDYLSEPKKLQFELSSMCNALCLGCVRTDTSTFNNKKFTIPDKQYITFDVFKKILHAPEFSSVTELEFCGTIDDPLMHPHFLEFVEYASTVKSYNVLIHTNASLRSTEYWTALAAALRKHDKHVVKFNIDGLEDTNHIYRQNTKWSKIMENAQAFIDAGGNAYWQFLIFPWNQHQVDTAKKLSQQMGFNLFASRHDRSIATTLGLEKIQKIKVSNIVKKVNSITSWQDINSSLDQVINNSVDCDNKKKKMYFISFDSKLWPCCFLNNGFFNSDQGKIKFLEKRLYQAYDSDNWNDISVHSISDILSHRFYKNDLVSSWYSKEHGPGQEDRIHRCTEVCNVKTLEQLPIGNYKVL